MQFNINDFVRVKLTDVGRAIHRQRFRELHARMPLTSNLKYTPPNEDTEGWSRWQMWELMELFGDHVGLCKPNPFDLTIEIPETVS